MSNKVFMGVWYENLKHPQMIELALARNIRGDVDHYLAFVTGEFAKDVSIYHNGKYAVLRYNDPKAHYLFEGKSMSGHKPKHYNGNELHYTKTFHPKAGADPFNRAKEDHLNGWNDLTKELIFNGIH